MPNFLGSYYFRHFTQVLINILAHWLCSIAHHSGIPLVISKTMLAYGFASFLVCGFPEILDCFGVGNFSHLLKNIL